MPPLHLVYATLEEYVRPGSVPSPMQGSARSGDICTHGLY